MPPSSGPICGLCGHLLDADGRCTSPGAHFRRDLVRLGLADDEPEIVRMKEREACAIWLEEHARHEADTGVARALEEKAYQIRSGQHLAGKAVDHRCRVAWTSKFSGLPLRCTREEKHEGACRAVNGWRDQTEATEP